MQTVNRVSIKKYTLYYWRSWNLITNISWLQISQKANKFFQRISVLASKMVQIKKKNISYQILHSWFLGDLKTRKFANEISWPLKDHHQHHFLIVWGQNFFENINKSFVKTVAVNYLLLSLLRQIWGKKGHLDWQNRIEP